MKSDLLTSAIDIEVGDTVLYDHNAMEPCKVIWFGRIFAELENAEGKRFSIMRNRLSLPTEEGI